MPDDLQAKLTSEQIAATCRRGFGSEVQIESVQELGGGTFNETYLIELTGKTKVILRVAPPARADMDWDDVALMRREHHILPFFASIATWMPKTIVTDFTTEGSMNQELRQALSHILWIGGAPDTGKTTASEILAKRLGLQVYNYDRHDRPQLEHLAQTHPRYRAFLAASLEDNWVRPEPEDLLQRALGAFRDRFPLVIEELVALPRKPMTIAEGFGLTPELVAPLLSSKCQAIWLVPTQAFKWASMRRRRKPSFRDRVSDPERATRNVFTRDMLLAKHVQVQARARGLMVREVDGSRTVEEIATLIERHFESLLRRT